MTHEQLRAHIERARIMRFWGTEYEITPLLIDEIFGDGLKLLAVTPLFTRPNFYVVRVDSALEDAADLFNDDEERLIQAIEEMFGNAEDEDGEDSKVRDWPAWHDGGYSYGFLIDQPLMAAPAALCQPAEEGDKA